MASLPQKYILTPINLGMVYAVKHISFLIMGPVGFTRLKFRIYCANKFVSSLCANIGHFPAMTKPPRMCPSDVKKVAGPGGRVV